MFITSILFCFQEREAHLKASERRETCMKELAGRQKKQAKSGARSGRKSEADGWRGHQAEVNMDRRIDIMIDGWLGGWLGILMDG